MIDELTCAAAKAEPLVSDVTGLVTERVVLLACIVDRPEWVRLATESMRVMTNGTDKSRGQFNGRITGAQTGAILACVASRILGQYDPFAASKSSRVVCCWCIQHVIAVERQLRVEPSDFRLWMCLHEVTHWIQFTANRWLFDYMSKALDLLTQKTSEDIRLVVGRLVDFVRSRCHGSSAAENSTAHASGIPGLVRAVQSESQLVALDQLLVLGTLLERHVDHVMDAVGPMAVPSVTMISFKFDKRRYSK